MHCACVRHGACNKVNLKLDAVPDQNRLWTSCYPLIIKKIVRVIPES